jgi:hypothetical protein
MSGSIIHFNCNHCRLDFTISNNKASKCVCPRCGCGQDIRGYAFRDTINGYPNIVAGSYRANVNQISDKRNSGTGLNSVDRIN